MKRVKSLFKKMGNYYMRCINTVYGPALKSGSPIWF